MKNMFKSLLAAVSLIAALSITAADTSSVGVTAGYNNNYVVNGVVRNNASALVAVDASKSLKYADIYVKGTLLPNNELDQSHWTLGTGKTFSLFSDFGLRAEADVTRHQSGVPGIPNSTEVGAKLALSNPWVTPYVRGSFNLELEQKGYFFGAERAQKLPFGFVLTPAVEWGRVTDYDTIHAKAELTRPFTFAWGAVTPFAGIGWYDNPEWNSASTTKFALRRFQSDTVYNAGLKFSF